MTDSSQFIVEEIELEITPKVEGASPAFFEVTTYSEPDHYEMGIKYPADEHNDFSSAFSGFVSLDALRRVAEFLIEFVEIAEKKTS